MGRSKVGARKMDILVGMSRSRRVLDEKYDALKHNNINPPHNSRILAPILCLLDLDSYDGYVLALISP